MKIDFDELHNHINHTLIPRPGMWGRPVFHCEQCGVDLDWGDTPRLERIYDTNDRPGFHKPGIGAVRSYKNITYEMFVRVADQDNLTIVRSKENPHMYDLYAEDHDHAYRGVYIESSYHLILREPDAPNIGALLYRLKTAA